MTKHERLSRAAADLALASEMAGPPSTSEIERALRLVNSLAGQCASFENPAVTMAKVLLERGRGHRD